MESDGSAETITPTQDLATFWIFPLLTKVFIEVESIAAEERMWDAV